MIIKQIDGKDRAFGSAVVDHSQLSGNGAYGVHPIEAIRGLSATLRKLQSGLTLTENDIAELKTVSASAINLISNLQNQLTSEITARETSDTSLSDSITNAISDITDQIATLETAVDTKLAAISAKIAELEGRIDIALGDLNTNVVDLQTATVADVASIYETLTDEGYIPGVVK